MNSGVLILMYNVMYINRESPTILGGDDSGLQWREDVSTLRQVQ